jgi:glycosyltransferase involved in cell wall biosynthesis
VTAKPRLLLIPGVAISGYEAQGQGARLPARYNPAGLFAEVHCLAPWEDPEPRRAHGLWIRRVGAWQLEAAAAALAPSLVRADNAEWAAAAALRLRPIGAPVVVFVQDPHPRKIRRCLRFADRVICVSEAVRQEVLRQGVAPAQTAVLYNRIDLEVFRPLSPQEPAVRAVRAAVPFGRFILHVGRRRPEKNIPTVLAALARLPAAYGAVFVGSGDAAPYRRRAEALGVADRCRWREPVPNDELPAWYAACDVFCVPSLWEAFGYVFAEAAACGAVIVTSDIGGMNEYLVDGESALLVGDYEDPAAVAAAVRRAAEDAPLRARLQAGAPAAVQRFDRHRLEREEADLYRAIIAAGPRRLAPAEALQYRLWRLGTGRLAWSLRHPLYTLGVAARRLAGRRR